MSNPNPVNPFPKNRKVRVGRKPGVPNNFTRELKEALLDAAEEVGEVEEEEILDKDGNSTGKFRRKATGKGGLKGYTVAPAASQPLILLGDLSRLRVRAELDEHDVGKIAIGGAVVIRAYAFRNREFAGKVATIAPTVRPGRISSPESGHLTDFSVNEVLIDLEDPGPLLVGMKVDAYFRPQK
jgi:hypothetical protein